MKFAKRKWKIRVHLPMRLAFIVLLLATFSVTLVLSQDAEPGDESAEESEEDSTEEFKKVETYPFLNKSSVITTAIKQSLNHFAEVEVKVERGYREKFANRPERAATAFNSAYHLLVSARNTLKVGATNEELVRDLNSRGARDSTDRFSESWRPIDEAVNRWLALLPSEYQEEYHNNFEGDAAAAIGRARREGDQAALRHNARRYLFTASGTGAAKEIIQRSFEEADFLDVVVWCERIRELRPNIWEDTPTLLAMENAALGMLGDGSLASAVLSQSEKVLEKGSIRKGDTNAPLNLSDALEQFVTSQKTESNAPSSIPALGMPKEFKVSTPSAFESGYYWTPVVRLKPLFKRGVIMPKLVQGYSEESSSYYYYSNDDVLQRKVSMVWYPDWSNRKRVLELSALSTFPSQQKRQNNRRSFNGDRSFGQPATINVSGASIGRVTTSSDSENAEPVDILAAVMSKAAPPSNAYCGSQIQLFNLNEDGKHWLTLPRVEDVGLTRDALGFAIIPEDQKKKLIQPEDAIYKFHFSSVPVIYRNQLLVAGNFVGKSSCESCLFAFDIDPDSKTKGKLLRRTKLSAIKYVGGSSWYTPKPHHEESELLISGRRVFVTTNAGSVACVDAIDGSIEWLVSYRRDYDDDDYFWGAGHLAVSSELKGNTLIVYPSDGSGALAVPAHIGTPVVPLHRDQSTFQSRSAVLGTAGGRSYMQTHEKIYSQPYASNLVVEQEDSSWAPGQTMESSKIPPHLMRRVDSFHCGTVVGDEVLVMIPEGLMRLNRFSLEYVGFLPFPDGPGEPAIAKENEDEDSRWYGNESELKIPSATTLHYLDAETSPFDGPALAVSNCLGLKVYPILDKPETPPKNE